MGHRFNFRAEPMPHWNGVTDCEVLIVEPHQRLSYLAVLIVAMLTLGFFGLAPMSSTDPQKIGVLRIHMAGGMLILALMVIRFMVRMWTSKPAAAPPGHRLLDRLAPLAHHGFYVLVLLMAVTGYATAILAGLPAIVFGGSGAPLPASFAIYPTRIAHGYLAALLVALIAGHVLAAFYHHFVKKDGLFGRMFFRRRTLPEGQFETSR